MSVYMGYTFTQSSAYYRMIMYAKKLKRMKLHQVFHPTFNPDKFQHTVNPVENQLANEKERLRVCKQLDFLNEKKKVNLWIYQLFSSPWGLALQDVIHKKYRKPFITEIDDWALGLDGDHFFQKTFAPGSNTSKVIIKQCMESDALIVSNEYLKQLYQPFNQKIYVVPNSIDFTIYNKLKNTRHKRLRIGWEGGSGHEKDLAIITPVITKLSRKYKNIDFVFTGGELPAELEKNPNVKHIKEWIPVNEYPKYKARLGFDIELAPLADTQFNRGKSNLRYLEASALKIPTIASDVGPYKTIKGLKCKTPEDWEGAIELLIKSPSLRKKLGQEAYQDVKENYNANKIAKVYSSIIDTEIKEHKRRIKRVNNSI